MAMEEIASITATAEERLMAAAEDGDIDALYDTILKNPELFKELGDTHNFKDTPLHKAAAKGQTKFVKELMVLQPAMARKLNQDGLSAMHIAVKAGHKEIVLSLLKHDVDLVRVRGKNGHTPLHCLFLEVKEESNPECEEAKRESKQLFILKSFLEKCPQCMFDVTNEEETALHLAAKKSDKDAFRTLMDWLWSSNYSTTDLKGILDAKDTDSNTVLHIAAYYSQPEILRHALLSFIIDLKALNSENKTAWDLVGSGQGKSDSKECADILRYANRLYTYISPLVLLSKLVSKWLNEVKHMSGDSRNALLVVSTLILTATYQSALSPPGGVYQANANTTNNIALPVQHNSNNDYDFFTKQNQAAGSSVLETQDFLVFFIPNIIAFSLFFLVTCFTLISYLPIVVSVSIVFSLSHLLFCLLVSAARIISPNTHSLYVVFIYVYQPFYLLCLVCIIAAVLLKRIPVNIRVRKFLRGLLADKVCGLQCVGNKNKSISKC